MHLLILLEIFHRTALSHKTVLNVYLFYNETQKVQSIHVLLKNVETIQSCQLYTRHLGE